MFKISQKIDINNLKLKKIQILTYSTNYEKKKKPTNIGGNLLKYNIFKMGINLPLTPFD
jgi:hypothetical protein